jgi:hypothetical protein
MSEHEAGVAKFGFACLSGFLSLLVICVTVSAMQPKQLGPEYVKINGKDMQCIGFQVTQTESVASCDWASIKDK